MTRDEALDKVKKLLALAEGEGATPGEAANAAAAATTLMERYRLAAAEVETQSEPDEAVGTGEAVIEATKLDGWVRILLSAVCVQNGCRSLLQSRGAMRRLLIIGRPSDAAVAEYTFSYLRREITRLADLHRGAGRSYLNAFRIGAVTEVQRRLASAKREARQGATSTAIVRVDARDAAIDAWCEQESIGKARKVSYRPSDADAYHAGRKAGADIPLHPGVGPGDAPPEALPTYHDPEKVWSFA